jgi:hypothetical protein
MEFSSIEMVGVISRLLAVMANSIASRVDTTAPSRISKILANTLTISA